MTRHTDKSHYIASYFLSIACILVSFSAFNWAVDPLQFYRKAPYKAVFFKNQRVQCPGLAKNYPYDTVIIGTSHTENFQTEHIKNTLGFDTLKLSLKGSTAKEQNLILQKAIDTGKVKNVIWGIESKSFNTLPDQIHHLKSGSEFPLHLYNENFLTHTRYLLSWDTVDYSVQALRGIGCTDLNQWNAWPSRYRFGKDYVWEIWEKRIQVASQDQSVPTKTMQANIDANLLQVIKNNPEIQFYLFFPPFSVLSHVLDLKYSNSRFDRTLQFKKEVVNTLNAFKNCHIYDFQTAEQITHNLDNYMDLTHYGPHINNQIIDAIAQNQYLVTLDNYELQLQKLHLQTERFGDNIQAPKITTLSPRSSLPSN